MMGEQKWWLKKPLPFLKGVFAEDFRTESIEAPAGQPPYRESLLTRVLSDSFGSDEAMVVAIGTVSPAAKDTEHSIGSWDGKKQD